MTGSWMLARLDRETEAYHHAADDDRMAIMTGAVTLDAYRTFLSRIHGFEAPVEAALAMTPELDGWIDLRGRTRLRLLRADLSTLGVVNTSALPRCESVCPFRDPATALGWLFVVERNTRLHGIVERHLHDHMPNAMRMAGTYLAARDRSAGTRRRELGEAIDRIASQIGIADEVVAGARAAFRCQHGWYQLVIPPRRRVA